MESGSTLNINSSNELQSTVLSIALRVFSLGPICFGPR